MHYIRRICRPISTVLIFTNLSFCLQPLSVLAKEPAEIQAEAMAAVRQEAKRNPRLAQKLGMASGADSAPSRNSIQVAKADPGQARLERIESLLKRLHPEINARSTTARTERAAPAEATQTPANGNDPRLAAIGPDLKIEVKEKQSALDRALQLKPTERKDALTELRDALAQQRQSQSQQLAEFAQTRAELQSRKLNRSTLNELLARHDDAMTTLKARSQQFGQLALSVEQAKDEIGQLAATAALAQFFKQYPVSKSHTASDPQHLPWGSPSSKVRTPIESEADYRKQSASLGFKPQATLFAGGFGRNPAAMLLPTLPILSNLPMADDLVPTEDVQLTPAIVAKATELGKNPVKIYNWVRNNIEFIPSYGSIQGSDLTLKNLRGNAFDTASLLIALLRASNISARYVYGTIQLPIEQAKNWVGGVTNPAAVQSLLGQGGVPNILLASGGQIVAAKLEHVWVEAWIDYVPSRGAKHIEGDTWVPLDASYKQYDVIPSLLHGDLAADAKTAIESYFQSGTNSGDGRWATSRNQDFMNSAVESVKGKIGAVITANPDKLELEQLIGGRVIKAQAPSVLLGSLPYSVLATAARMSALPEQLRLKVLLEVNSKGLYGDDGSTLASKSLDLTRIGYDSLNLTFAPYSPADVAFKSSYAGKSNFPAYLLREKAQIRLNGEIVAETSSLTAGDEIQLKVTFIGPLPQRSATFNLTVGDELEIGVDGSGQSAQAVHDILNGNVGLGSAAGNMYVTSKAYWTQQAYQEKTLGQLNGVGTFRLPSVGIFSVPLSVVSNFGINTKASYRSRQVDIKLSHIAAAALDGDTKKTIRFVQQAGLIGSGLEGGVIEQVFSKPFGHGSNTVRMLELANATGIPIYHITPENMYSIIPELNHDPDVLVDINNALLAGNEVVIPKTAQKNGAWSGSAYLMYDPQTGSGDYRVNGASGNFDDDCQINSDPISVPVPNISFLFFMLFGFLVDDDFDFNGGGAVALVTVVLLSVALFSGIGAIALAGTEIVASATGIRGVMATMAVFMGMSEALAGEEDSCSCDISPAKRKGGHVFHNICSNRFNEAGSAFRLPEPQGNDAKLRGKHFDAYSSLVGPSPGTVYEIKTGMFYSTISGLIAAVPKKQIFLDALLEKAVLEFSYDRGVSGTCRYEFKFGVRDPVLNADLKKRLLNGGSSGNAERVFMNGC